MQKKIINKYISASAENNIGEITFNGDITNYRWFDEDVSPTSISDTLKEMGQINTLELHMNSDGGSVTSGNTIINIIRNYKVKNKVNVYAYVSWAASMASGIVTVADKVFQYENGLQMIHKPIVGLFGNSDDMRKIADTLDKYEETLIANYMNKFNGEESELREMLSMETTLTAQEALECGLCDEIIGEIPIVASVKGIKINNFLFERKEVMDKFKEKIKNIKQESEEIELKYNETLNEKYDISEEYFNGFKDITELTTFIENKTKEPFAKLIDENGNIIETTKAMEYTPDKQVLEELDVKDVTMEQIINWAKLGKEVDLETSIKAKHYDKMFQDKIQETISSGIRANGPENFQEDTWIKAFKTMSYDEVCRMEKTWNEQAKNSLNAGTRVSQPKKTFSNADNKYFDEGKYKF